jgi:uncharacterized membrane protein YfcA
LAALPYAHIGFVLFVVGIAYVVRGLAGFGSGLIATPLLLMLLPLKTVVPLVVVLDYLASAVNGLGDRQRIAWREILRLLPSALIGVVTAFWLLATVDARWLVKVLAILLIGFAVYQWRTPAAVRPAGGAWALPAGAFGGLIGTLFGTGGPFYVAYLHGRQLDKSTFRATFSTVFLLDGANRIAGYALSGFFDWNFLAILLWLIPVMVVGLFVGRHLHTNVGQQTFRRGISVLLLLSGVVLLFKSP